MALLKQLKISKWLKPAWQHADPQRRIQALHDLSDNIAQICYQVACEDKMIDVRIVAIQRITDLEQLHELSQQDNQQAPQTQLQSLFKQADNGISNGDKIAFARRHTNSINIPEILADIEDEALRAALFGYIDADAQLCLKLAIEDASAKIRYQAAEILTEENALQKVLHASRKRDKQVYRRVKEKLDAIETERQRPIKIRAERDKICRRLGYLLQANDWQHTDVELAQLEQQWQAEQLRDDEISTDDQALDQQYQNRRTQCLAAIQGYQEHLALEKQKQALYQQLDQHWQALQTHDNVLSDTESQAYQQHGQDIENQWLALPNLQASKYQHNELENRYQSLNKTYRQTIQSQRHQQQIHQALQQLSNQADSLLQQKAAIRNKDVQQLEKSVQALEHFPHPIAALSNLQQHFQHQLQQLQQRLEQQKKHHKQYRNELKQQLDLLSSKLEQGELQQAKNAASQVDKLVGLLPHADRAAKKAHHDLQQHHAKIRQLSGWQRWGNNRERETLCEEMENLAKISDADWSDVAKRIRTAQAEWKKLQKSDQGNQLWQRFNNACQAAYAPCDKYFKQQAGERNQHQQQRDTICKTLLDLFANTPWEHNKDVDWKGLYKQVQQHKRNWHQVGVVNHKQKRRLQSEFQAALAPWEQRFDQERKRNFRMREQLILRAEDIAQKADDTDVNHKDIQANIKALQKNWHITVPDSHRAVEKQLWERFSQACDSYYKKRRAEQQSFKQNLQDNLKAKTALCEQLESLLSDEVTEQKLDSIQAEWFSLGSIPKQAKVGLEKRYHRLFEQLRSHQTYAGDSDHNSENGKLKTDQWMGLDALRNKSLREQFLGQNKTQDKD